MAGKIVADTLEHSTAGSIATNYVVDGSAKALIDFDGRTSTTVDKSMNISGLVDESTGRYTISYTTSYDSADYHFIAGTCTDADEDTDANVHYLFGQRHGTARTSSQIQCESFYGNAGNSRVEQDADNCDAVWFGDLA
jgi:hypothetical protein